MISIYTENHTKQTNKNSYSLLVIAGGTHTDWSKNSYTVAYVLQEI
jgi:hypothetical protein